MSANGLHRQAWTPAPASGLPTLGRYQIVTRLAMGGMAEVFLARHGELSGFKTLVVVKKVLPHLAEDPDFISMFLDEARIASLLDHPNVVRIFEVGRSESEYFLAMELVQGKPLASLIRRAMERKDAIDPKLAALVIAQAAHGLHHAHGLAGPDGQALALVHRDVSPQNILVSFEGSVKVIDFGIARALGRFTATSVGERKGKTGYMSPEQARSEPIDRRSDIFALGVVLWETVCRRRLFTKDTDFATMQAILYDPIPTPSSVAEVPQALEKIIMRALQRDPAARFQSAHGLATSLERFIFQKGGTSAADLGSLMKSYFAEDIANWKVTTRTALDIEEPSSAPTMPELHLSVTGTLLPASLTAFTKRPALPTQMILAWAVAAIVLVCLLVLAFSGRSPKSAILGPLNEPQPARPQVEPLPHPARAFPAPRASQRPPAAPPMTARPSPKAPRAVAPKRAKSDPRPAPVRPPTPTVPASRDRLPNPFQ